MKKWYENNIILMTLSAFVFVGGYFFLRLAYHISDKMPFTQEIVLIILGTLATVLITAMLLNKQTEVELQKEQSIKFLELKSETYQKIIDLMEEIVQKKVLSEDDKNRLVFNTHRLALVASPAVLNEYQLFLEVFNHETKDGIVSVEDANHLNRALARLTIFIRKDLIGELDDKSGLDVERINKQILSNADMMQDINE
jgi:hypothetical protein